MLKHQFGLSGADHLGSVTILPHRKPMKTPKDPIGSHEKPNCSSFSPKDMGDDPLNIDVVGTFMVDVDITYGCCLNSLHMRRRQNIL